ncbi:MAG TPA: pyridoxal-dependent decarboxylase [Vicinamibacterales bacterium]|jgi:aromatic-L-amino-acid decarboxylase|nr:pyridoxal-dependent decarboxylase [Vicinamibacterales bacterium]
MDGPAFRRHGYRLVDWIADYLDHSDRYPVLSRVQPGDIRASLPSTAPDEPEDFEAVLTDFERILVPGLTHWNHPGFFGYFAITGSPPGVLAEFLCAALNQQAMLWRTSPAATELEEVSLGWLRQLIGLPDSFEGVIYDTASMSTMHALIAARQAAVSGSRLTGLAGQQSIPQLCVYCSAEAHSSVDKGMIAIGLGLDSLRRIPVDDEFRLRVDRLEQAIAADRAAGRQPIAVVATIGTTSTTSVDPVQPIAEICERERMWLHVDAAYAGAAAMLPSHAQLFDGIARADSLVLNPHKWLFAPVDLSAFYCRRMDIVRDAFSLTPEYLKTTEAGRVKNLMDTGVQLGRRFRALKLWMILRTYGVEGLRSHLNRHVALARAFAGWVDAHPEFERLAPVPFSVVCFRWRPVHKDADLDALNEKLLSELNETGEVFLSHTRINGCYALRLAVGHIRTEETHVRRAWNLILDRTSRL